ncbi:hypothetical protein LY76DRAFT_10907 [Colletotrichum caudatum]|nr:hypothetical protein LY76DRAFT_10907 [Colletotrichum caudatum]
MQSAQWKALEPSTRYMYVPTVPTEGNKKALSSSPAHVSLTCRPCPLIPGFGSSLLPPNVVLGSILAGVLSFHSRITQSFDFGHLPERSLTIISLKTDLRLPYSQERGQRTRLWKEGRTQWRDKPPGNRTTHSAEHGRRCKSSLLERTNCRETCRLA